MYDTIAPRPAEIDDHAGAVLGTYILERMQGVISPGHQDPVSAALDAPGNAELSRAAGDALKIFFGDLGGAPDHISALRDLGAAFTQARECGHAPPEGVVQTQWNRLLRDQGERLRAASMTLSAGQIEVARAQLAPVGCFFDAHFRDLPR
jgi:hypothetical protein